MSVKGCVGSKAMLYEYVVTRGAAQEYEERATDAHGVSAMVGQYFSISQGLKELDLGAYDMADPDVLRAAQLRGTGLHYYFSFKLLSLLGLCAPSAPKAEWLGYAQAIDRWVDERKISPVRVEEASVWRARHVAGRPDALVLDKDEQTIVELKTTAQTRRVHRVQVMVQQKLEFYREATALRLLYVHPDGSYNYLPVLPSPTDLAAFENAIIGLQCAINVTNWRRGA